MIHGRLNVGDELVDASRRLRCRVVAVGDDDVMLERLTKGKSPNSVHSWTLSLWFMRSPSCGWVRDAKAETEDTR